MCAYNALKVFLMQIYKKLLIKQNKSPSIFKNYLSIAGEDIYRVD